MSKKKKKAAEKEPNLERWLVSYADFITLLFAVFVTLYAMSMVDKKKVQEVRHSIQTSFGYPVTTSPGPHLIPGADLSIIPGAPELPTRGQAETPNGYFADAPEFNRIKDKLQSQLAQGGMANQVKFTVDQRGLVVSLKAGGFFDSGSDQLQPAAIPVLDSIADSLKGYTNNIRVEGHTDNVPVHSKAFPSNWELSTARATNIVHYLIEKHHYKGSRLSATGYGEYRPVADNSKEAGRQLNRRVDIVLLSQKGAQGEPVERHEK